VVKGVAIGVTKAVRGKRGGSAPRSGAGIGEIEEILPANSMENVKEFLAYPGRWEFTREA